MDVSVVSYSISTSNHNRDEGDFESSFVVSYSISTSNHNYVASLSCMPELYLIPFLHQTTTQEHREINVMVLYLIPFLHQTTTNVSFIPWLARLYLIPFLHQTTTATLSSVAFFCCILFHFYIKPQQHVALDVEHLVVSYSISTSNHNSMLNIGIIRKLYLIPFLHQTTTLVICSSVSCRCILFHFYIKPQPKAR